MFPDEEQDKEELKRLEADLASLVPRRDRVDPDWSQVLAEIASQGATAATAPSAPGAGQPCTRAAGHVFACVHCGAGIDASTARPRRWAWPTAFSAMTTVAAALLILLAVRPVQPMAELGATAGLSSSARAARASARSYELERASTHYRRPSREEGLTPMAALDPKFFDTLLASNSGPWLTGGAKGNGPIGSDEEPPSAGALLRGGWSGRGDLDELIRGFEGRGKHHSTGAEL